MSELDIIKDLARQSLMIQTPTNGPDNFLWDRALRLVRNVEFIRRLPQLSDTNTQIDQFCLTAAAYFSGAGLACHLTSANITAKPGIYDTNGDNLLDICTQIIEEKLKAVIDRPRIRMINSIITESHNRYTKKPEAMILSDARNLDDMGAVGIFSQLRQLTSSGKSTCDALRSWERKTDYRYWQTRLKEDFRFEQVRKLAEQRLSTAEHFMSRLKIETEARDVQELIIGSPEQNQ